jgi:hypothetical protein
MGEGELARFAQPRRELSVPSLAAMERRLDRHLDEP